MAEGPVDSPPQPSARQGRDQNRQAIFVDEVVMVVSSPGSSPLAARKALNGKSFAELSLPSSRGEIAGTIGGLTRPLSTVAMQLPHKQFATIRFQLPDESFTELRCAATETLAEVKERLWARVVRGCAWMHAAWWHGSIDAQEAERRLRMATRFPAYLVRRKENSPAYVVTFAIGAGITHHDIVMHAGGFIPAELRSAEVSATVEGAVRVLLNHCHAADALPLDRPRPPRRHLRTGSTSRMEQLSAASLEHNRRRVFADREGKIEIDLALYGPVCGNGPNFSSFGLVHRSDGSCGPHCFFAEEDRPLSAFPCFMEAVLDETRLSMGGSAAPSRTASPPTMSRNPFSSGAPRTPARRRGGLTLALVSMATEIPWATREILGDDLSRILSNGESRDVAVARERLLAMARGVSALRDPTSYALVTRVLSQPPPALVSMMRICLTLEDAKGNAISPMPIVKVVEAQSKPVELIAKVIADAEPALARRLQELQPLVLKIPDRFEFIHGDHAFIDFAVLRKAALENEPITLQLTPIPALLEIDPPEPGAFTHFYSTLLSAAPAIGRSNPVVSTASSSSGRGSGGTASEGGTYGASISFEAPTPVPSHGDLTDNVLTHRMLSVWSIQQPFAFELLGADGFAPKVLADHRRLDIELSLVHGGEDLAEPIVATVVRPRGTIRLHRQVAFKIKVCDLPRSVRLVVKIVSDRKRGSDTKDAKTPSKEPKTPAKEGKAVARETGVVAIGACSLFSATGSLTTGACTVPLILSPTPEQQHLVCAGICSDHGMHGPFVVLRLATFAFPVIFPNEGTSFIDCPKLADSDRDAISRDAPRPSHAPQVQPGVFSLTSNGLRNAHVSHSSDRDGTMVSVPRVLFDAVVRLVSRDRGIRVSTKGKSSFKGKALVEWLRGDLSVSIAHAEEIIKLLERLAVVECVAAKDSLPNSTYKLRAFTFVQEDASSDGTGLAELLARRTMELQQAQTRLADAHYAQADLKQLAVLSQQDVLTALDKPNRTLLLRRRHEAQQYATLLPKFLHAVNWGHGAHVREAYRLLPRWTVDSSPAFALELLHHSYADSRVRAYAAAQLAACGPDEIDCFLLQLVQVLRFESLHDGPLARLLLRHALSNRRLGNSFFWLIKACLDVATSTEATRLALLLDVYLRHCGNLQLSLILKQCAMLQYLGDAAAAVLNTEKKDTTALASYFALNPPPDHLSGVPMLYDISLMSGKIVPESCRVMVSKKRPLWLHFTNADPRGGDFAVIFKAGDDLRQDMLTLQLLRVMDQLWRARGLDLGLTIYGCTATSSNGGMIQAVSPAKTVAQIQRAKGTLAEFKEEPLYQWLRAENVADSDFNAARDAFVKSCAGYCVATYVMGIGDRHNDNIMITPGGRIFHIDFGHFMGNTKYKFGFNRERVPFVLTPDFAYVMDRRDGERFKRFVLLCKDAYTVLRDNARLLIALFAMMLATNIPELNDAEDIAYLQRALNLGATSHEAEAVFERLIDKSLADAFSTQLNFWAHNQAH
eukprot:m.96751 g.96751  ORF g.96751 m.96751 type:complete len:1507 (+) comp13956_c0_seq1:11-4531(+)